jgi:hypothetical protein
MLRMVHLPGIKERKKMKGRGGKEGRKGREVEGRTQN